MSNDKHIVPFRMDEQTMLFNIRHFASLSEATFESPRVFSNGFHWILVLVPHARQAGHVGVALCCAEVFDGSVESVRASWSVAIRAANHPPIPREVVRTYTKQGTCCWGFSKFCKRDDAISCCDAQGTLQLIVTVRVYPDCWTPGKSNAGKLASLYDSEIGSGAATFVVGDDRFEVHRFILEMNAPVLAALLGDSTANQNEVTIDGVVDPVLFGTMIRFLYTEELPPNFNDENNAVDLLELADKYGCSNLKMVLEARIVQNPQVLCLERAANLFVLAHGKNCALLLERSEKMIVKNIPAIYETEGWQQVHESRELMEMIMTAQARQEESVSVSDLRTLVSELGQNPDGTRETLLNIVNSNAIFE